MTDAEMSAEIEYRANERLGMLMDDQKREPTREEVIGAWWMALRDVREMNLTTEDTELTETDRRL